MLKRVAQIKKFKKMGLFPAYAEREINVSQQILTIVASMLHMHHNRLGLHLTDECWLSYLALRIISPESKKYLFDHELSCAV